jgi:hypothetical protein
MVQPLTLILGHARILTQNLPVTLYSFRFNFISAACVEF